MFKVLWIYICIFVSPVASIYAQQIDTTKSVIQGIVRVPKDTTGLIFPSSRMTDDHPRALPSTNISVLNLDDSIFVNGTHADSSGKYLITGVAPGHYLLQASYVGFENKVMLIIVSAEDTLHKDIVMGRIYPPEELPFGAEEASKNFKHGKVVLRTTDTIKIDDRSLFMSQKSIKKIDHCENKVAKKFHVSYKNVQQEFEAKGWKWHKINQAVKRYNHMMKKLLEKHNGLNWYERYQHEFKQCTEKILKQVKDSGESNHT